MRKPINIPNAKSSSSCPIASAEAGAATGCPLSPMAEAFDAFEGPYQVDPADALRWSRAEEPVFFAPKLGYWVVTRYEEVKAVFRDNITFSPSIALKKMTPTIPEVTAVLAKYDYAMNRTLVNEDEPAHMARRRALMHSFDAAELAHHEPMVRRLVRDYVDRFIDKGTADLVDDMLWEIPLTVALHFLGVPEEDMNRLREYSIAHTVNTWGRPSPSEQIEVAEAVGKFWQYAGGVLDRMRINPEGHGWMEYAIRRQKDLPQVVTDSYLHSMMMAGIVAAHETTAHASANAFRLMLENRSAWEAVCADPELIPNAVEECLRYSGSVVAWRRIAMTATRLGNVDIPEGAKMLIVSASANHDERHFEDPDSFDIYRPNTTDHLTFGYGSHQCMGKNLARMEMRIFFDELTRRLPHLKLVPDQEFTFLPNTSFRGPDHLMVYWDPALNPERCEPTVKEKAANFAFGAPATNSNARNMRVVAVVPEADNIISVTLEDEKGQPLPTWSAGAHVDLILGDYVRKYSLCSVPGNNEFRLGILREARGRGASEYIHRELKRGASVKIRGPKNHFRLDESADHYILIAGGIGITPIIAMADRLKAIKKPYVLHYAVGSRHRAAFTNQLARDHLDNVVLHIKSEGKRMDIDAILRAAPDAQIYACGPERMTRELERLAANAPERLHVERFSVTQKSIRVDDRMFQVELRDSGITIEVQPEQTLLEALRAASIDVASDCEEGLCGTCEVSILAGAADHRDAVLTATERASNCRMMACCSRAQDKKLVLAL